MIGVICKTEEREIAKEFFELFKTPWEFFNEGAAYPVILSTDVWQPNGDAKLFILYGSGLSGFDAEHGTSVDSCAKDRLLDCDEVTIPVYGRLSTFDSTAQPLLKVKGEGKAAAIALQIGSQKLLRVGYDLLQEIKHLLSQGQPAKYAATPTLEIHIALLRRWVLEAGMPLMEIPPAPYGYDFIACLTHDIDFAAIKDHKFDHTMFGFLYRALVVTIVDALRGKAGWKRTRKNLRAALMLPAVHLRIVTDFWSRITRYLELEKGLKSTFFFLPFKGMPGKTIDGQLAPRKRGAKYDIDDLRGTISHLVSEGCEVGLHGIDAWHDFERAGWEMKRIASVTGKSVQGVRMHWLYFGQDSPEVLEKAGLSYDSTLGYNDGVGFFAGTSQAFKLWDTRELLELPLTIQDTAMFYSGRMNLGEEEAFVICKKIIENVWRFGGVLVINWHDRSLAPERLWGDFYVRLVNEIKSYKAWFATGLEAANWFRKRRAAAFTEFVGDDGAFKLRVEGFEKGEGPDLKVRFYGGREKEARLAGSRDVCEDVCLRGGIEVNMPVWQNEGGFS